MIGCVNNQVVYLRLKLIEWHALIDDTGNNAQRRDGQYGAEQTEHYKLLSTETYDGIFSEAGYNWIGCEAHTHTDAKCQDCNRQFFEMYMYWPMLATKLETTKTQGCIQHTERAHSFRLQTLCKCANGALCLFRLAFLLAQSNGFQKYGKAVCLCVYIILPFVLDRRVSMQN